MLTINTTAASASLARAGNNMTAYITRNRAGSVGGGIILSALLFFGVPVRRGWKNFLVLLLIVAASAIVVGCGGGATAVKGNAKLGTTPGDYSVTVMGVAGTTMATTHVAVTLN
jgi:hypothetical protein